MYSGLWETVMRAPLFSKNEENEKNEKNGGNGNKKGFLYFIYFVINFQRFPLYHITLKCSLSFGEAAGEQSMGEKEEGPCGWVWL